MSELNVLAILSRLTKTIQSSESLSGSRSDSSEKSDASDIFFEVGRGLSLLQARAATEERETLLEVLSSNGLENLRTL
jgi:hypothetical protein